MAATVSKYCRSQHDDILLFFCSIWNYVNFCFPKTTNSFKISTYFSSKETEAKWIEMHRWKSLNLASWTFLVSKRSASVKFTTVLQSTFRVYIESLTMSSQEPPKKKSKRENGLFCLYIKCTCVDVCILCQYAPACTIWKNIRLITALNYK